MKHWSGEKFVTGNLLCLTWDNLMFFSSSLFFSQILDGALCRAFKVQREFFESTTGYTFTPCVGSFTSPGIDTR